MTSSVFCVLLTTAALSYEFVPLGERVSTARQWRGLGTEFPRVEQDLGRSYDGELGEVILGS